MSAVSTLVFLAALAAADDPLVLEFTSRNCPACRAVEPVVRQLTAEGFPIRQIDGDTQPQVARQFQIKGYPTFVLVSGGQEAGRITGVASRERLVGMLESLRPVQSNVLPEGSVIRAQSPEARRTAGPALSPDQAALAATVRLRVEDSGGSGFGTGTIIDTHYNEENKAHEALVVTCGHLFRESQGKGKITVELFSGGAVHKLDGTLLNYSLERDIALVTFWPGTEVTPAQVAPKNFVSRPQDRVFSVGCSKGKDPTVEVSRVNAINKFLGKPNITAAGMPVDGRSGGGLFSSEGLLIGVCNAANPADDEGLYASLASIQWQLDRFNLQEVYERASVGNASAALPARQPVAANEIPVNIQPASFTVGAPPQSGLPELPPQMPRPGAFAEAGMMAAGSDDDTEVVCIVRSKRNPENQSEIYLVDHVSPELLSRITTAARESSQARASGRNVQPANSVARQNRPSEEPVIRGQIK